MLSVRSNLSSLVSSRYINLASRAVERSLAKLSTGKRINSAADDPSGLAIAAKFKNQILGMAQARLNSESGSALAQTAEGGVFQITSILHRLSSLAIEAANSTLTSTDRGLIQSEVEQLIGEIDRLASVTSFNNIQLLKGSSVVGTASLQIQVGWDGPSAISLNFMTMTSTALGINSLNLSDSTGTAGSNAIDTIKNALEKATRLQAKLGAYQNRLQYAGDFVSLQEVYTTSALSAIEDTDFANELSRFTQGNLLVQSATGTLAQSNMVMQKVLTLLGVGN